MALERFRPPRWLHWFAVAFVSGGILYASLLDSPSSGLAAFGPLGAFRTDKWLHALAYAALAGTLASALAPGRSPAAAAALAGLLAAGYGVGIEFAQAPLAERYFSFADMAANATGAGLAVLGYRFGIGFVGGRRSGKRSESEV
jgi:VanZ family protein